MFKHSWRLDRGFGCIHKWPLPVLELSFFHTLLPRASLILLLSPLLAMVSLIPPPSLAVLSTETGSSGSAMTSRLLETLRWCLLHCCFPPLPFCGISSTLSLLLEWIEWREDVNFLFDMERSPQWSSSSLSSPWIVFPDNSCLSSTEQLIRSENKVKIIWTDYLLCSCRETHQACCTWCLPCWTASHWMSGPWEHGKWWHLCPGAAAKHVCQFVFCPENSTFGPVQM